MNQPVTPTHVDGPWRTLAIRRGSAWVILFLLGIVLVACQSTGAPVNPPGGGEPPPAPQPPAYRSITRVFTLPFGTRFKRVVIEPSGQVVYLATEKSNYLYSFDPSTNKENWRYKISQGFQNVILRPNGNIVVVANWGTIYEITPAGELVYEIYHPMLSAITNIWVADGSVVIRLSDGNRYTLEPYGGLTLLEFSDDVPGSRISLSDGAWLVLEAASNETIVSKFEDAATPLWSLTLSGNCSSRARMGSDLLLYCRIVEFKFGENYFDSTLVKLSVDGVVTTVYESDTSSPDALEPFTPMDVSDDGEVYFLQTSLANANDTVAGRYLVALGIDGTVKWKREGPFTGSGGLVVTPAGDVVVHTFERYENKTRYSPRLSGFDRETAKRTWQTHDLRYAHMLGADSHGRLWIYYGYFGSTESHFGYVHTNP